MLSSALRSSLLYYLRPTPFNGEERRVRRTHKTRLHYTLRNRGVNGEDAMLVEMFCYADVVWLVLLVKIVYCNMITGAMPLDVRRL